MHSVTPGGLPMTQDMNFPQSPHVVGSTASLNQLPLSSIPPQPFNPASIHSHNPAFQKQFNSTSSLQYPSAPRMSLPESSLAGFPQLPDSYAPQPHPVQNQQQPGSFGAPPQGGDQWNQNQF